VGLRRRARGGGGERDNMKRTSEVYELERHGEKERGGGWEEGRERGEGGAGQVRGREGGRMKNVGGRKEVKGGEHKRGRSSKKEKSRGR